MFCDLVELEKCFILKLGVCSELLELEQHCDLVELEIEVGFGSWV